MYHELHDILAENVDELVKILRIFACYVGWYREPWVFNFQDMHIAIECKLDINRCDCHFWMKLTMIMVFNIKLLQY